MHRTLRSVIIVTLLSPLAIARSWADAPRGGCQVLSPDCVEVGQWSLDVSLGAGTRTNPVTRNADIPLVVIPHFSYYGKRFFLDNLELGFTLHEGAANTFNLLATPGYDRVFFNRHDPQNVVVPLVGGGDTSARIPVPPRHTTVLAGPEWLFRYGKIDGQLSGLYEVTGRHKGYEVRSALSAPLVESRGSLVASLGITWKSTELVRYYYGIEDTYEPGAALNPFVKLAYDRWLNERWSFRFSAHYERLDNSIADSPIISDHAVATVFAGFDYRIL